MGCYLFTEFSFYGECIRSLVFDRLHALLDYLLTTREHECRNLITISSIMAMLAVPESNNSVTFAFPFFSCTQRSWRRSASSRHAVHTSYLIVHISTHICRIEVVLLSRLFSCGRSSCSKTSLSTAGKYHFMSSTRGVIHHFTWGRSSK